ncbi:MaoC/PaaZ C-terminal domain-containing protein [Actinoplanes oblitus]|uniref:MaoC/PaaZ C-terminal domain-containing protein n=1 Tax=Actinoplanes oblitus TaxID=3040509 RepID=A0ABY8W8A5_9ACTN|nr:MaoC/PaaZ C-terminal domain-containing protein [Actinoplanes oblitus]WIM94071.1 MaoC/PaaZ C-terminal domain-containing protein [Actinoplanes oblitus]
MAAVVELSEGPGTGAAYVKAALGMLRRGGDTLPDVELVHRGVTVDRGHLARYDRVCGLRLTDTLPATYPHILAFPLAMRLMSAADFPLPMIGLVHVSNRITVRRPIDAGSRLDLAVRAVDLREHPRGRQFDVVATASVDGAQVWRGVSTYLRREAASPSSAPAAPAPPAAEPPAGGAVWRLPARTGTDYAAVSGDRNPIHTSRVGAKLFGFPRQIAHGMWTKARCLAALEGRLPESYAVEVAFKQPILLPSTVRFTSSPAAAGWEFAVHAKRPHLTGSVLFQDGQQSLLDGGDGR